MSAYERKSEVIWLQVKGWKQHLYCEFFLNTFHYEDAYKYWKKTDTFTCFSQGTFGGFKCLLQQ